MSVLKVLNFTQSSDEMKKTNTLNENKLVKLISEAKKTPKKTTPSRGFLSRPQNKLCRHSWCKFNRMQMLPHQNTDLHFKARIAKVGNS